MSSFLPNSARRHQCPRRWDTPYHCGIACMGTSHSAHKTSSCDLATTLAYAAQADLPWSDRKSCSLTEDRRGKQTNLSLSTREMLCAYRRYFRQAHKPSPPVRDCKCRALTKGSSGKHTNLPHSGQKKLCAYRRYFRQAQKKLYAYRRYFRRAHAVMANGVVLGLRHIPWRTPHKRGSRR